MAYREATTNLSATPLKHCAAMPSASTRKLLRFDFHRILLTQEPRIHLAEERAHQLSCILHTLTRQHVIV
ncbi:MAG: hypothetical protein ACI85V_000164 [bacterium]|jgi:hypothetical protein